MPDRIPFFKPAPLGKTQAEAERAKFYNSAAWLRLRAAFLLANPLCAECGKRGLVVEARIVHHVEERLRRPDLALDRSNLESLCPRCHTAHHARLRAKGDSS
jgi:5-methylcytosine-specific restriction endonuclease McrA